MNYILALVIGFALGYLFANKKKKLNFISKQQEEIICIGTKTFSCRNGKTRIGQFSALYFEKI